MFGAGLQSLIETLATCPGLKNKVTDLQKEGRDLEPYGLASNLLCYELGGVCPQTQTSSSHDSECPLALLPRQTLHLT